MGIYLYAGDVALDKVATSGYMSIYFSSTPDYNTTGTLCMYGVAVIIARGAAITCSPTVGTKYVTIVRGLTDPLQRPDYLVINELRVIRGAGAAWPPSAWLKGFRIVQKRPEHVHTYIGSIGSHGRYLWVLCSQTRWLGACVEASACRLHACRMRAACPRSTAAR